MRNVSDSVRVRKVARGGSVAEMAQRALTFYRALTTSDLLVTVEANKEFRSCVQKGQARSFETVVTFRWLSAVLMIHTVVTLLVLHVLYSTVQSGKLLQYEQGSFDLLNMRKVGVTIGGAGDPRKELMGAMLARLSPAIIIAAGRRIGKYCNVEVIQCTIYLSTHRYDDLLAVSRRLLRSFHNESWCRQQGGSTL